MAVDTGETVDITPTWRGLVMPLLVLYEGGDREARSFARRELFRMAYAADAYVRIASSDAVMDMSVMTEEGYEPGGIDGISEAMR